MLRTNCVLNLFIFSALSFFSRGELWVIEKLKGEREVEAERADRGSDRCCGPEEARPCDRLSLTRPSGGKKGKEKKTRLPWLPEEVTREDGMGVKPT